MTRKFIFNIFQFIDRFHWLWLVLAVPFLVFPSPKRSLALIIVPTIWIIYILSDRQTENNQSSTFNLKPSTKAISGFPITPLNINLLVLTIMLLISLWATYSIEQSLEKISGLVLGLGVFFAIVRESQKFSGWLWSLAAFLGGGLGWALLGFLGMNYQVRFSVLAPVISRIPVILHGLPGADAGLQHNAVGGTLVWILPLMLSLSWYTAVGKHKNWGPPVWNWLVRINLWGGTLFVTLVLFLTQSRGSYLAMGLTTLLVLFIILPVRRRWVLVVIAFFSALIITLFIYQSGGWEPMITRFGLSGEAGFSIDTLGARLELWPRAIYGIQDFPITGMGMNTFRDVVHVLYPFHTISPDFDIAHAHNEFLQVGLDLGIPGLIAFVSIYITAFWTLLKIWCTSAVVSSDRSGFLPLQDPILKKALVLGLGGGMLGHIIFGMTDAITLGAKPGIFYWMILGLITGWYVKSQNGRNDMSRNWKDIIGSKSKIISD